jgi:predicted acylesterase/phospholipase RssA
MIPYRIYLSGGGMASITHIGALQELSTHVSLQTIKHWMGVSAGGLLAMCLSIGYTLDELMDLYMRFDFTNLNDVDSISGWVLYFGMDTGDRLYRLITACLHVKGLSSELTFKELYEQYGCSLQIVATDLNDGKPILFGHDTTPAYQVANAVRASASVPYYYQPFICPETGHFLVDGACTSNIPLFMLSKDEQVRTLSILIRTSVERKEVLEIQDFLLRPLNVFYAQKMHIESAFYDSNCIQIMLDGIDIMDFSLAEEVKREIIQKGKEAVHNYFTIRPKPKRRNSL